MSDAYLKTCSASTDPALANALASLEHLKIQGSVPGWWSVIFFFTHSFFNPRSTKPFFVTWLPPPLMNWKLTGPKYDCLVPGYRVGSLLSIDTKIMKIGQRMTSQ